MVTRAVITGDIVNSTRLIAAREKQLLRTLTRVLSPYQFEFYRGDSFQVYQKEAGDALRTALLCRAAAISLLQDKQSAAADVRLSIGIGEAKAPAKTLGMAKGTAFVLSGRAFDEIIKSDTKLVIASGLPLANAGLQVIAGYLDAIFAAMTGKQAIVLFELLNGATQQEVAEKLKKSKSTIHQHVSSGRWPEIEWLLQQYENIIHLIT